jgi:NADH-quinone oxidoreductase subunit J
MEFLFFTFAGLALFASLFVVFSANPVHSVLSLILVFSTTSMLLLLLRVDFLSLLLVVVYVGAIAVLFLFVVMMLNVKLVQLSESTVRWLPLGLLVALALTTEVFYVFGAAIGDHSLESHFVGVGGQDHYAYFDLHWLNQLLGLEFLSFLGSVLYSYFFYSFVVSSFVLLVALIGAIVLTVGSRRLSRRQHIYKQVSRDVFSTIRFYR